MTYTTPTERDVSYGVKADADWNILVQDIKDHEARIEALESTGGTIISPTNVPIGVIAMWSGAVDNIPTGWSLCNGGTVSGQVTPNLCDYFVLGAGSTYSVGDSGGAATHNHAIGSTGSAGGHTHTFSGTTGTASITGSATPGSTNTPSALHSHSYSGTTGSGGSHSHGVPDAESASSMPPYYALCFIMRTS